MLANSNIGIRELQFPKSKVKLAGWPEVGNGRTTRESVPFSLALDKGDLC